MPDQPRYAPHPDGTAGPQPALLTILSLPAMTKGCRCVLSRVRVEARGERRAPAAAVTNRPETTGTQKQTRLQGGSGVSMWGRPPPNGSAEAQFYGAVFSWPVTDSLSLLPGYTGFT